MLIPRREGESAARERGQRVLVTGGGTGIGRAIADHFVAQGARVSVADLDASAIGVIADQNDREAVVLDVTDATAVDAWVSGAADRWSGIDVLVNNVGTPGPVGWVEDLSVQEWRDCLSAGLESHFLTCRRVMPIMKAQSGGSIIAIGSTAGLYGYGQRTPYAVAKWGLVGFMKSLAIEGGPWGIRANVVCPGSVAGPRIERVVHAEAAARGLSPDQILRQYVSAQSIARLVDPAEVASIVTFLASTSAAMVSGQVIAVDGNTETFHLDD